VVALSVRERATRTWEGRERRRAPAAGAAKVFPPQCRTGNGPWMSLG